MPSQNVNALMKANDRKNISVRILRNALYTRMCKWITVFRTYEQYAEQYYITLISLRKLNGEWTLFSAKLF
jgi:hypothetical protein